jgi:hypothetical protein
MASFSSAQAAVSAEEAAKLKTVLTPLGAERAGNKEGTIPAWTGGFTQVPSGYKSGHARPDFFSSDKPVLQITGKNMDQYADKLSETNKALLKKYPGYRLDVYQTRRTASAPQWVYDNTFKNATSGKLTRDGNSVEGALGGIPFPIPKNGDEVAWNHRRAWSGENAYTPFSAWVVTGQGKRYLATKSDEYFANPYYFKDMTPEKYEGVDIKNKVLTLEPASKSGEALLAWMTADIDKSRVWQYLVGQRRVRRTPNAGYDTPNFIVSGVSFFDEAFGLYGSTDRHNLKIIGKKEMYVPYNNNKAALASVEQLVTPNYLNPDLVRWELHRVWEVEATLREGKRHAVAKRRYYIDEDTWTILLSDGWDAKGELWHGYYSLTLLAPDVPALLGNVVNWGGYNLQTGEYYYDVGTNGHTVQYQITPRQPDAFFSADGLANEAAR